MKRTVTLALLSILLVAAIIMKPDEAFRASLQGLTVWWNIVFPGLLPFLTLLELMTAFGVVHAFGTLLQPLMHKLFRLPGEAGVAVAFGWTGGFPCGAEATSSLRKSGALTAAQGNRLLALAHMPNPIFIIVVVGTGFLHRPELGVAILLVVWLAALAPALALARLAKRERAESASPPPANLLRRAAAAMRDARKRDGRSFGKLLGDGVTAAVYKLMAVGGFMIFCAVLVRLLAPAIPGIVPAYALPGLIESHIGSYAAATASFAGGLPWKAAAAAAVLSWGGFSAMLQAGAAVIGAGLSLRLLAVSRVLQSAIAFLLMLLAWKPISRLTDGIAPAFSAFSGREATSFVPSGAVRASELHTLWPYAPAVLLAFVGALLLLSALSAIAAKLRLR
ncbi:nucleoside recognition protein [Paenibacillus sp. MWE-103]|uniref:Nucleoside recognition protein n=1 Tax=Paenibacillus artemisiicola TaxID=1172618 RepID=A0ABS3W784_9BACL|nr:nucleoside recognition domain-containing protein [Paenibacillus artemisiicola]MBO7744184.1 nucleoside recognition protein [Paenibacillus artemisiicola]